MAREDRDRQTSAEPESAPRADDIAIADDVIAAIAAIAAREVDGVAALGSRGPAVVAALARRLGSGGVRAHVHDDKCILEIEIVVAYGRHIPAVARSVQEAVRRAVEGMAEIRVAGVHVHVCGVALPGHGDDGGKEAGPRSFTGR